MFDKLVLSTKPNIVSTPEPQSLLQNCGEIKGRYLDESWIKIKKLMNKKQNIIKHGCN